MPLRSSLIAAALLATAVRASAQTRPADPVAVLIRQLGADEEADRTAAQRQLVDLGTTAADALRTAAATDPDPEVRSRATAAVAEIADREANGPTLVTVHARRGEAGAVLADLARQARGDVVVPAAGGPVTLDADRRPFWDAFADAAGQAGLCPVLTDAAAHAPLRLAATDRNWMRDAPHQTVGPFFVAAVGVYHLSAVDLAGPPVDDDQFLARLVVLPEPKLVVTAVSPLAVRVAVDDAGHSLMPTAAARPPTRATAARLPARTVEARLRYPADGRGGTRIATLSGDLAVTVAQDARRLDVDLTGPPTVRTPLPGVRVRVGVEPAADLYRVTVECVRTDRTDPQWAAMVDRVADVAVADAAGRPLTPMGWLADAANTATTFKATGLFARDPIGGVPVGPPQRLAWTVADRFRVITVPVTFHDLPMP